MHAEQDRPGRLSQVRTTTAVAVVALVLVVASPAAASARGLVGFGRDMLGLSGPWALLVPVTLDGAALYAAALSLRAVLAGESATGARALVALYALGSSAFNAAHALYAVHADGGVPAAAYFGGMSVSAVVLWETTLRHVRRGQLRELGALPAELPRFRLLRWVLAPCETPRVWRHAVLHEITQPQEALTRWHASREIPSAPRALSAPRASEHEHDQIGNGNTKDGESNGELGSRFEWHREEGPGAAGGGRGAGVRVPQPSGSGRPDQGRLERADDVRDNPVGRVAPGEPAGADAGMPAATDADADRASEPGDWVDELIAAGAADPDPLAGLSKREALQTAFGVLGSERVAPAREWLAARGVHIDESYAYALARDAKATSREHAETATQQSTTRGLRVVGKENTR